MASSRNIPCAPSGRISRRERVLLVLLGFDCLAVLAIWTASLAGGAFEGGVLTYQLQGTVPIFHLVAEFAMALVTLLGLIGYGLGRQWGRGTILFGVGMLSYSAVNALGWALHNDLVATIPMILTLLLAAALLPLLLRRRGTPGSGA